MSDFRKRLLCIPKNNSRLPKEYKEVEYIEGTGTQYLSTGYVVNQNSVIDVKLMLTTQYSGYRFLFGSGATNSVAGGCTLTGYNAIYPIYYYGIYYSSGGSMSLNTVNVIKAKKSGITINGTTYSVNPSNPSATVPLYIFNSNMNGTAGGTSGYACVPMRLYYFTISE